MTIHDQMLSRRWKLLLPWDRIAARRLIAHAGVTWIGVSDVVCNQLHELGVPQPRIMKLPAYIPLDGGDGANKNLPEALLSFVGCHQPVITTYAWMLVQDDNGEDLHSLDHCVDLVRELRVDHPNVGLVILLGSNSNPVLMCKLRQAIQENGVEKQVLIHAEPLKDARPLWRASDVYLRATTTDGDSLSVREALSECVPVVASDAAPRPGGTLVFQRRNYASLTATVKHVLRNPSLYREALKGIAMPDGFGPLLKLYERLWRQPEAPSESDPATHARTL